MVTCWSMAMQELDFKIHFVPGFQNKWADTLSRLCPNLMELAMDYTPRVMDAPGFIVAALTTCPLASEEESEWMEQAHNSSATASATEQRHSHALSAGASIKDARLTHYGGHDQRLRYSAQNGPRDGAGERGPTLNGSAGSNRILHRFVRTSSVRYRPAYAITHTLAGPDGGDLPSRFRVCPLEHRL